MENKIKKNLASVLLTTAHSICNSESVVGCIWNELTGCSVLDEILGALNDSGLISDEELRYLHDSNCDRKTVLMVLGKIKLRA